MASRRDDDDDDVEVAIIRGPGAKKFLESLSGSSKDDDDDGDDDDGDKGKRKPVQVKIARCDWVQGNISAQRSKAPALDYLERHGIIASYDDGWMD